MDASQSFHRENLPSALKPRTIATSPSLRQKDYEHDEQGRRCEIGPLLHGQFHRHSRQSDFRRACSFYDGRWPNVQGLAHRLNNWAKAVVGVRPKPTS